MKWLLFILLLIAGAILDAGNLLNWIAIGSRHIRPSVLIVVLVYFSLNSNKVDAVIASFLIGLFADLSGTLLGPNIICYGIMGTLLSQLKSVLLTRNALRQAIIVVIIATAVMTFAYWLSVLKTGEHQSNAYSILFLSAVYSALIAPVLWSPLEHIATVIGMKQSRHRWNRH